MERGPSNEKGGYKLHARICKALANPKRLEIIDLLSEEEKSVKEITEAMELRKSNVSQHLAVLRQNSLVNSRRDGRQVYYSITDPKIIEACQMMREVALNRLVKGKELIEETD